jgi:hypothetical protein
MTLYKLQRKREALWHLDPLLGGVREIGDCTAAIARQRPANKNRGMLNVRSMPRCYKQDRFAHGSQLSICI